MSRARKSLKEEAQPCYGSRQACSASLELEASSGKVLSDGAKHEAAAERLVTEGVKLAAD